jgi:hypothetical protein
MNTSDSFTRHASRRTQQRCVPPLIDEWLDRFGEESYDGRGGIIRYFSKRSIRDMERSFGREPVRRMSDKLTAYKVEDSRDGRVLTAGYRFKHVVRK